MAQAATVNVVLGPNDPWTKVATNPLACTIHSNGELNCQIAITTIDAAPTVKGEVHFGRVSWQSGDVTGYIWIKSPDILTDFAVTVLT